MDLTPPDIFIMTMLSWHSNQHANYIPSFSSPPESVWKLTKLVPSVLYQKIILSKQNMENGLQWIIWKYTVKQSQANATNALVQLANKKSSPGVVDQKIRQRYPLRRWHAGLYYQFQTKVSIPYHIICWSITSVSYQ